jgi:hypothetical protein
MPAVIESDDHDIGRLDVVADNLSHEHGASVVVEADTDSTSPFGLAWEPGGADVLDVAHLMPSSRQ